MRGRRSSFFFERLEGFTIEPSRFRFRDASGATYAWGTCYAAAPMRRHRGIATEEGDRATALESYDRARAFLTAAGLEASLAQVDRARAQCLQMLGRGDEAEAIMKTLPDE